MSTANTHARAAAPNILLLVLIASVGPLAMNIFLPSLPAMAAHFNTDYSVIQLLVSLFLVALGLAQLIIGPLSDRFGRRPVLLICLGIFCVATICAIFAPDVQTLLAFRFAQAAAASGIVLSRAIVRDTSNAQDTASRIAYVTMGMSLTPMIAPFIGGILAERFGWEASFWLTFGFGLTVLILSAVTLHETNLTPSSSMLAQFRAYPELARSPRFWGYTATAMFASGAFFAFVGGGPYVATEMLHMTPSEYGLYFGLVSLGYMLGNFLSGRFSRAWGMNRMMMMGNMVSVSGMLLMLGLFAIGLFHPLSLFLPSAFVGIGNGMTLPSANAGIVSVRPQLAGSASGLGGALTPLGGAAMAALASSLLGPQTGPYPLAYVCLGSLLAAVASTLLVIRRSAQVGELD